jgi:hypothetical protein
MLPSRTKTRDTRRWLQESHVNRSQSQRQRHASWDLDDKAGQLLDSGMCSERVAVRGSRFARPSTEASPQNRIAEVELSPMEVFTCVCLSPT